MPIYEEEGRVTREALEKLRKRHQCLECGARLALFYDADNHKAFLACTDWQRSHHEGIEREPSRYETGGLAELTINRRREIMELEHGRDKTTALEKAQLPMTGALTQPQAMHILQLVYPNVPEAQIIRTAILCRDFGLHPLMKEVYIIGFKNKAGGVDYSTVIGITASRKMAADKKGSYSFVDLSPRAASRDEIAKQYGENSEEEKGNLVSICMLKGQRGNEAVGYGLWPKDKNPYGTDKGNTPRNMANIRAERQALDRLPGEALPLRQFEVIDDAYVEVPDIGKVDRATGEIVEGETVKLEAPKEHWCEEHSCSYEKKVRGSSVWYAHKLDDGWCNEIKKVASTTKEEAGQLDQEEHRVPTRDPNTVKTLNELYKACNDDFRDAEGKGMQPDKVLDELGVSSQSDISDSPADCYRKVAAVR